MVQKLVILPRPLGFKVPSLAELKSNMLKIYLFIFSLLYFGASIKFGYGYLQTSMRPMVLKRYANFQTSYKLLFICVFSFEFF